MQLSNARHMVTWGLLSATITGHPATVILPARTSICPDVKAVVILQNILTYPAMSLTL